MKNKYPDYMMEIFRQRDDLDINDTSKDNIYNNYSPKKAFKEMCEWEGLIGWSEQIKIWIRDTYNIDVDNHICTSAD
jgi:hypothetical protein